MVGPYPGWNSHGVVSMPRKQADCPIIRELTARRVSMGLARIDLARKAGYDVKAIERYERGETTPNVRMVADWCEALGMKLVVCPKGDSH